QRQKTLFKVILDIITDYDNRQLHDYAHLLSAWYSPSHIRCISSFTLFSDVQQKINAIAVMRIQIPLDWFSYKK
ncbi:MAG: hypothetical protein J6Q57_01315, partial [Paraprevotella sp.]|nr:hypothetical protein [Paraprevotella sp.]